MVVMVVMFLIISICGCSARDDVDGSYVSLSLSAWSLHSSADVDEKSNEAATTLMILTSLEAKLLHSKDASAGK
jgi:hypothetical protein